MKLKNIKNIASILLIAISVVFITCDKNDDITYNDVVGTYEGTLTIDSSKAIESAKTNSNATAVVSMVGDQIEVHCFGDNFDTIIMLGLYHNGNEINVCLTGDEFEEMYGHMQGQGHMNGNGSEWMQHLNNEHQDSDEHFGGFDMQHHSFNYTFETDNGNFHFQGIKQ
jgi:hypothetical protein